MASVIKDQSNIVSKDGKLYLFSPTEDGTMLQLVIVNKDSDSTIDRHEPDSVTTLSDVHVLSDSKTPTAITSSSKVVNSIPIWTGKKDKRQLAVDKEATKFFLEVLKQNWYLLHDGKTKKKVVWEAVGEEMANKHFELGENAGQKCEQKWSNLYRKYKEYIKEWEKTGSEEGLDDLKSPYHEEILAIIGEENNCFQPTCVGDSFLSTQNPEIQVKKKAVVTPSLHRTTKRKQMESDEKTDKDDTESEVEEIEIGESSRKNNHKTKRKKTKTSRASTIDDIVNILKDNVEYERKRDEERKQIQKKLDKERKEKEKRRQEEFKEKEKAKMQRHAERMSLAKAMVKAILKSKKQKSKETSEDSEDDL